MRRGRSGRHTTTGSRMSACPDCGFSEDQCRCDEYEDDDAECSMCNGEGWFFGSDLPGYDPGWHDPDGTYHCPSCNGSGNRKDMTIW